ncbi:MAG: ExeM/NucH family extracellular endonuclease [Pseudomonadota bacterium]
MAKLLGALSLGVAAASADAVTLVQWDTAPSTSNPALTATTFDPSLIPDQLSAGAGLSANSGGTWNWRGWDTASTSFGDALAAGDFWTWGFDVGAASVTPTSMDIRLDRSGSGPDDFEIQASVNGGTPVSVLTFDYGDSGSGVDFVAVDLSSIGTLNAGDSIVFTLAAFNSESNAGTFDLETVGFGGSDPRSLRISGTVGGAVDTPPSVISTTPANGATSVQADASIEIAFSEAVTVGAGLWFDIDCTVSGNDLTAVESSADSTSFTLDPVSDFTAGETCTVTVVASEVQDQDGTADSMSEDTSFSFTVATPFTAVFINELHYDNTGGDIDEFVEVAGPTGTDLTGWSIVLYNGNGGGAYSTVALAGTLGDDTGTGFGFVAVDTPGIQNGGPDGLALVNASGEAVQFLSYEGSFTATNGAANGLLSTDIGQFEPTDTPLGLSLQLSGDGTVYEDFTWAEPAPSTAGCVNGAQTFAGGALPCGEVIALTIPQIQGSGAASEREGQTVSTTGIVTGDFQGVPGSEQFHPQQLSGFFIQDADGDGDSATSDGIFVFCGSCATDVGIGDEVAVTGEVVEFFDKTQINVTSGSVEVLSTANPLPNAALIDLPLNAVDDLEAFEGMLVTYVDTLTVSEYFELNRFGEVVLYEGGRPFQFTHTSEPSVTGFAAHEADLARRRVILDDDANGENQALEQDLNVFYPIPGLSITNFFRGGDSISGLTGVLDFGFGNYRVRPVVGQFDYSFQLENPRSLAPADVGGTMSVVSANVLNFFPTIDVTESRDFGDCGPSGTLDCRGADSAQELQRQSAKLAAALCAIDGDIVGLSEIENDASGSASLQTLVNALNATNGCGAYTFINAGPLGTDAIKVAMIYKSDTVTPVGPSFVVDDSVDPAYRANLNRPTLIQVFEEQTSGERVIVAAHHLKSKGSDCDDVGDPDLGDGQGNCSQTRATAAGIVADFINDVVIPGDEIAEIPPAGTDRVLVVGDLNAYKKEDAVTAFIGRGYVDLIEEFNGNDAYSFVFDGQRGYLDHALGLNISDAVTGVTEWHINADEINLFDYNDDVLDEPGEPFFRDFEEEPDNLPLFEANAFRSSDHDPVIVGLEFGPASMSGDLDGDGNVDMDDYAAFLSVFRRPASFSALAAAADYNDNGVVDLADFGIWRGLYLAFLNSGPAG